MLAVYSPIAKLQSVDLLSKHQAVCEGLVKLSCVVLWLWLDTVQRWTLPEYGMHNSFSEGLQTNTAATVIWDASAGKVTVF